MDKDLVDALAELHVVLVVVGGVVDGGVGGLERGLGAAAVREGAPVVRDEGLRGVAPGKGLRTGENIFMMFLMLFTYERALAIGLLWGSLSREQKIK